MASGQEVILPGEVWGECGWGFEEGLWVVASREAVQPGTHED